MDSSNVDTENVQSENWDMRLPEEGEYQTKDSSDEEDEINFNFEILLEELQTIDNSGIKLGLFNSTRMKNQNLVTILTENEVHSMKEKNELLRSCPSPVCTNSVLSSSDVDRLMPMTVSCLCGHAFCYSCFKAPHDPIPCSLLDKWYDKQALHCNDEVASSYWVTAKMVSCPTCHNVTEIPDDLKFQIITCPNGDCLQTFCWKCSQSHPDDQACVENTEPKNFIPEDYDGSRFMKYKSEFQKQQKKLQLEPKFLQQEKEWKNFRENDDTHTALEILHDCRETVMFATVLSFFLECDNQAKIFKENVLHLSSEAEKLSNALHWYIKGSEKLDSVIRSSKFCKRRRLDILDHAIEGFQKEGGYWKIRKEE